MEPSKQRDEGHVLPHHHHHHHHHQQQQQQPPPQHQSHGRKGLLTSRTLAHSSLLIREDDDYEDVIEEVTLPSSGGTTTTTTASTASTSSLSVAPVGVHGETLTVSQQIRRKRIPNPANFLRLSLATHRYRDDHPSHPPHPSSPSSSSSSGSSHLPQVSPNFFDEVEASLTAKEAWGDFPEELRDIMNLLNPTSSSSPSSSSSSSHPSSHVTKGKEAEEEKEEAEAEAEQVVDGGEVVDIEDIEEEIGEALFMMTLDHQLLDERETEKEKRKENEKGKEEEEEEEEDTYSYSSCSSPSQEEEEGRGGEGKTGSASSSSSSSAPPSIESLLSELNKREVTAKRIPRSPSSSPRHSSSSSPSSHLLSIQNFNKKRLKKAPRVEDEAEQRKLLFQSLPLSPSSSLLSSSCSSLSTSSSTSSLTSSSSTSSLTSTLPTPIQNNVVAKQEAEEEKEEEGEEEEEEEEEEKKEEGKKKKKSFWKKVVDFSLVWKKYKKKEKKKQVRKKEEERKYGKKHPTIYEKPEYSIDSNPIAKSMEENLKKAVIKKRRKNMKESLEQKIEMAKKLVEREKLLLSYDTGPQSLFFSNLESIRKLHFNWVGDLDHLRLEKVLNPYLAERFMRNWYSFKKKYRDDPSAYSPVIVFHGTSLQLIPSIVRTGLVIPGKGNPLPVVNGAAYGQGIYVSPSSSFSHGYCRDREPVTGVHRMLVCVAVRGKPIVDCVFGSEEIWVLKDSAQVLPLYVVHCSCPFMYN